MDRAFANPFSTRAAAFRCALPAAAVAVASTPSASSLEYQMSSVRMPAKSCMALRYAEIEDVAEARASAGAKPLFRAAITKLADRRATSYSNGPGSVSSKSFRSNRRVRSGEAIHAEVGQVRVAAQLHLESGARRIAEVGGHDLRRRRDRT